MFWLYHEDASWEPEDRSPGAGRVLYWLASAVAVVILVFAIADFVWRKVIRSCTSSVSQLQG